MRERRAFEVRADGRRLVGTVMRYGAEAPMWFGAERFEPGAFGPPAEIDAILNYRHMPEVQVASTQQGSLRFFDDDERLSMVAELRGGQVQDLVLEAVRSGRARGLSVEFDALKDSYDGRLRSIARAVLGGVGIVPDPAYDSTAVEVRAAQFPQGVSRDQPDSRRRLTERLSDKRLVLRMLPWL